MTFYKYAILTAITYASEVWSILISKRAKIKLQQIQRSFLIFITKAYGIDSNEALSAIAGIMPIDQAIHQYWIMPIDQAIHQYKDIRPSRTGAQPSSVYHGTKQ